MGLTWAAAWFGLGMALLIVAFLFTGTSGADVPFPLGFGFIGFLAGVAFSGVLALVEGRRRFDQISLVRFGGWGAVGGLLLSGVFIVGAVYLGDAPADVFVLAPVFAVAAGGSAVGSLAIARAAEDRELLEASTDVGEIGLTEDEKQALLGD